MINMCTCRCHARISVPHLTQGINKKSQTRSRVWFAFGWPNLASYKIHHWYVDDFHSQEVSQRHAWWPRRESICLLSMLTHAPTMPTTADLPRVGWRVEGEIQKPGFFHLPAMSQRRRRPRAKEKKQLEEEIAALKVGPSGMGFRSAVSKLGVSQSKWWFSGDSNGEFMRGKVLTSLLQWRNYHWHSWSLSQLCDGRSTGCILFIYLHTTSHLNHCVSIGSQEERTLEMLNLASGLF